MQQQQAALAFLKELAQERINSMGPAMQGVIGPSAQEALRILNELVNHPVVEAKPKKKP